MAIKTIAELKAKFETGDTPQAADFIDLIDTLYSAENFPNPLPAVSAESLTNIPIPNPLPALDGGALYNINPAEWATHVGTPNYASATTFVLTGDQRTRMKATRRLRFKNGASYLYTEVRDATYNSGTDLTTTTILDAVLVSGISEVSYSMFTPANADGAISARMIGALSDWLPSATNPPSMAVRIGAGTIDHSGASQVRQSLQTTAALVAPAANPRNDLVVYDVVTGAISVIAGAEAASPVDPLVPTNKRRAARVRMRVGMTSVLNSDIDDLRAHGVAEAWRTGGVMLTIDDVAMPGWVMCNDGTIGSAGSNATTRAHADTGALYTLIWNKVADAYAPVTGGRGASAAADFAANKPIALTKMLGRSLAIAGSGAGLTARALGATTGAETHVLSQAETPLKSHAHGISDPGHQHNQINNGDNGVNPTGPYSVGSTVGQTQYTGTVTTNNGTGITVNAAGDASATAHNNMQPTGFLNAMIKL